MVDKLLKKSIFSLNLIKKNLNLNVTTGIFNIYIYI